MPTDSSLLALLHMTAQVLWRTDAAGAVEEELPGWRALTGQSPQAMRGQGWLSAVHPQDRERTAVAWQEAVRGRHAFRHEARVKRQDGGECLLRWQVMPVYEDGAVQEWLGLTRDVTAEHEQGQELLARVAALEQRLSQYEQGNATSEMLADILSHDLRTPVRTVQRHTLALLERSEDPARQRQRLTRVLYAAHRIDRLQRDLLALNRMRHGHLPLHTVSLSEAVAAALTELQDRIDETGAQVDVALPLPAVTAHQPVLERALVNLIDNALKFVPDLQRPKVHISAEVEEGFATLRVLDNGGGIPPEQRWRVTGALGTVPLPGGSAAPRAAGSGLGLYIVGRGAQLMNAQAGVEHRPGGSAFWLRLPLAPTR